MNNIEYVLFGAVEAHVLLPLLNEPKVRNHLVDHPEFTEESAAEWMDAKRLEGNKQGCKTRLVMCAQKLVGWCGIQSDACGAEIAIVLSEQYWGVGGPIFNDMLGWAKELGHSEVALHLLESRPEYRFLARRANRVTKTQMLGRTFTSYYLLVE